MEIGDMTEEKKTSLPPLTVKPSTAMQCWSNPIFYSCVTLSVSLLTHQMNADPSCPITSAAVSPRSEPECKFHVSLHSGCFFFKLTLTSKMWECCLLATIVNGKVSFPPYFHNQFTLSTSVLLRSASPQHWPGGSVCGLIASGLPLLPALHCN